MDREEIEQQYKEYLDDQRNYVVELLEAGIVGIMAAVIKTGDMIVTAMKEEAKYKVNSEISSTAWNLWERVREHQP